MRKLHRILTIGMLMFSACKPQELNLLASLGRKVRVSNADGFAYASLDRTGDQIFKSDKKQYAWYGKGQISYTQGDYSGRLLHGPYESFYATNKQLKEKGRYEFGLKDGKWMLWAADGQLLETQQWYRGLKNGKTVLYDSLGNAKQKLKYRNGVVVEKKKHQKSLIARIKQFFKKKKK